ncbi:TipAS antibiotic-recognition domain-containing protein [Aldersonia sp. NBC_00410]|uniref:MerR family transcriptional regulator n=1 Tax=Aldersonia sp. NBC_00410 TaxID=2975954 RepID=UPI00225B28B8|nr:TipAS antibiotic-recognition domain-containing protein [Aldersonia sp. NBC_00410]MCX5042251.1 TipAS antibiotic-recognition domain-containing protein [Aldersonia sp. NBC_00410]
MPEEWSIHQLAKVAGATSRTLRHYGDLGLLVPTRIGANGYRYYGQDALIRLQRILLLRELGLPLRTIGDVLDGERDSTAALRTHLELLRNEQDRIARQIASVQTTLRKTEEGQRLMPDEVFDGFDHTVYRDEVIERWGREAYASGDTWWRSMSEQDKRDFQQRHLDIAADYGTAHREGRAPDSAEVLAIAARHYDWIAIGWQGRKPTTGAEPAERPISTGAEPAERPISAGAEPAERPISAAAFTGLGEMYVADPRFRQNYDVHGAGTAEFVRDAMEAYVRTRLSRPETP